MPSGIFTEQKIIELKRKAEAIATERQTMQMQLTKQRRYSETLAIDQTKRAPVQLTFDLPKHLQQTSSSILTVQQKAAPRGKGLARKLNCIISIKMCILILAQNKVVLYHAHVITMNMNCHLWVKHGVHLFLISEQTQLQINSIN